MSYVILLFGIVVITLIVIILRLLSKSKKADLSLINNQKYLNAIINNTPACVKIVDKFGKLLSINNIGLDIIEAEQLDDVVGHSIYDLITPEYKQKFKKLTEDVCNGIPQSLVFELKGLKGTKKWMETKSVPIHTTNGKIVSLALTEDITERVRVEEELWKSESLKNTILSSITDAFFALDTSWKLIYLNKEAEILFKKSKEELLGQNFWNEFPEMNISHFYKKYLKSIRDHQQIEFEYYYPESKKWLRVKIYPSSEGFSIFNSDITFEKIEQIINDLERSMLVENNKGKKRLNEIFDNAIRVVESIFPELNLSIHKIDENNEKLINFSSPSVSKSIIESINNIDLNEKLPFTEAIVYSMKVEVQGIQSQLKYEKLKNIFKESAIVSCISIPLFASDKKPLGVFTIYFENYFSNSNQQIKVLNKLHEIFREILEERKREDEVNRLSLIAKNTNKAVFITNLNQEIIWINPAFSNMTGYLNQDVLGKNPFEVLNGSESDQKTIEFLNQQMKDNQSIFVNTLLHKKNGSTYWSRITGQPMYDEIGEINQYFVIQEDTTVRKLAKIDLQDSEKRYRALFHSNPQPMFIYDKATLKFKEVNDSALKTYGYTSEEFNEMTIVDLLVESEVEKFINNDEQINFRNNLLLKTGIKKEEYLHVTKKGNHLKIEMVRNEILISGKETILVIIEDVTDKYEIEKELRRSNERFKIASKAVSDVIWEWDIRKNQYIWGEGITERFGYTEETKFPSPENFKDFIHPDDVSSFFNNYISIIKDKTKNYWSAEYRFKKEDNTYANVLDKAYIIRTSKGEAVKIIGALRDITEEKNHEIEKGNLINQTQEFERKRFSMELHDGLAQHLIVLNLYLSQFEENEPVNSELLKNCFDIVKTSLNQTRAMCYNLTPPELENGLLKALVAMFERFKKISSIEFEFVVENEINESHFMNIDVYNLYRIIQEFVNNSIKHSKASVICCVINKFEDHIFILLDDNGIGFDHDSVINGLGMNNIEKRAKLANVECEYISSVGNGTKLSIKI